MRHANTHRNMQTLVAAGALILGACAAQPEDEVAAAVDAGQGGAGPDGTVSTGDGDDRNVSDASAGEADADSSDQSDLPPGPTTDAVGSLEDTEDAFVPDASETDVSLPDLEVEPSDGETDRDEWTTSDAEDSRSDDTGPIDDGEDDVTNDSGTFAGDAGDSGPEDDVTSEASPSACEARPGGRDGFGNLLLRRIELDSDGRLIRDYAEFPRQTGEFLMTWDSHGREVLQTSEQVNLPPLYDNPPSTLETITTVYSEDAPSLAGVRTTTRDLNGDGEVEEREVEELNLRGETIRMQHFSPDGRLLSETRSAVGPAGELVEVYRDENGNGFPEFEILYTFEGERIVREEHRTGEMIPAVRTITHTYILGADGRVQEYLRDDNGDSAPEVRNTYEWEDDLNYTMVFYQGGSTVRRFWRRYRTGDGVSVLPSIETVYEESCSSSTEESRSSDYVEIARYINRAGYLDCMDAWRSGAPALSLTETTYNELGTTMMREDSDGDGTFDLIEHWVWLEEGLIEAIHSTTFVDGLPVVSSNVAEIVRDSDGNLLQHTIRDFNNTSMIRFTFTYDVVGNITSRFEETQHRALPWFTYYYEFAWDEAGRRTLYFSGLTPDVRVSPFHFLMRYEGDFPYNICSLPEEEFFSD